MDDLLSKFVLVVDRKSISAAATELGVSQPALSVALQKLERQLGSKLFVRSKQGIIATPIGEVVYKQALIALKQLDHLTHLVADLHHKHDQKLTFGMIDNVGLQFVRHVSKTVRQSFPRLKLHIQINNSATLISGIEERRMDFAVIAEQPAAKLSKHIRQKPIATESLVLVASPALVNKVKTLADIQQHDFFSYNEASTTHSLIYAFFKSQGLKPNYAVFSTSPEFIAEMLRIGTGLAFLPLSFVRNDLKTKALVRVLEDIRFQRKLALIYHEDTFLTGTRRQVIDAIEATLIQPA